MSALKIAEVTSPPEPDQFGNLSYFVRIEGVNGGVLVRHKGDKPVLKAGDDAVDHGFERVDDVPKKSGEGTYKKLMRPEANGSFGGGGGAKSPEQQAQIIRQHSQEMGLRYAALRAEKELLPEPFKLSDLEKVIDWFEQDAKAAKP